MSRLSEHQIRALISGMEATAQRLRNDGRVAEAKRTERRRDEYLREIAERFPAPQDAARISQTKDLTVNWRRKCGAEGENSMGKNDEKTKTTMDLVVIDQESEPARPRLSEEESFWKLVGRQEAISEIATLTSLWWAENLHRLKSSKHYRDAGMTWEQVVERYTPFSKDTADRMTAQFEEFGKGYFMVRQIVRISAEAYRQINPTITEDGKITIGDETFALTKQNAARIQAAVKAKDIERSASKEREAELAAAMKKLADEKSAAKKAAEKARAEFAEYRRAQSERWGNADADQTVMLDAQASFDMAMAQLMTASGRELSEENQARYIGVTEYMYRQLIQATHAAREKYGVGWNMAEPADLLSMEAVAPGPRNLVAELTDAAAKRSQGAKK